MRIRNSRLRMTGTRADGAQGGSGEGWVETEKCRKGEGGEGLGARLAERGWSGR